MSIIQPLTMEEFRELNQATTRLFVICRVPLAGGDVFFHDLEHSLYAPGTIKNDRFNLYVHLWQGMYWAVGSMPWWDRPSVTELAARHGMRLSNGVPTLLSQGPMLAIGNVRRFNWDAGAIKDVFPLDTLRAFTLEAVHKQSGPVVSGIHVIPDEGGHTPSDFWSTLAKVVVGLERDRRAARVRNN
jgi:hypothetical protein